MVTAAAVGGVVLRQPRTATIPVRTTTTAAVAQHQKRLCGPSRRRRRFFHLDLSLFFGESWRKMGGCLFGHFPLFAFIFACCSTGRTLALCTCYDTQCTTHSVSIHSGRQAGRQAVRIVLSVDGCLSVDGGGGGGSSPRWYMIAYV